MTLGIDLGTSFSSMARVDGGRAIVIRDAAGLEKIPSVVYYGDDETVVGSGAVDVLMAADGDADVHARVIASVKRNLLTPPRIALPGGRTVTPVDVAGEILSKLRHDAEGAGSGEDAGRAVITCPAFFDGEHAIAVVEAASRAGLHEVRILEEPVAAAIAFEHEGGRLGQGVCVYDWGGGTFDAAFLVRDEGDERFVLALEPEGDPQCGGDDLDQLLYGYFDECARRELDRPIASEVGAMDMDFLRTCRRHKESLSKSRHATFSTVLQGGDRFSSTIDRATFEAVISPQVERTVRITASMVARAQEAGYTVDTVLLVGGSSQLPVVRRRLYEELELEPQSWGHRDVAVALGAAYRAAALWPRSPNGGARENGTSGGAVVPGVADLVRRAQIHYERRRFAEAIAGYDRALDLDRSAVDALTGRGEARLALHRLDEALADFDSALEATPECADALIGRARVHAECYRLAESLADADRALELAPREAGAWIVRAWGHDRRRDMPAALDDFDRALELEPDAAEAMAGRGAARLALAREHEAIVDFERALELDASCVPALVGLAEARARPPGDRGVAAMRPAAVIEGLVQRARERTPDALAALERARDLRPASVRALVNRSVATPNSTQDDPESLVARALELDPNDGPALLARSRLRAARGDADGAVRDVDAALVVNPDDVAAMLARAQLAADAGRPDEAMLDLDRGLELAPFRGDLAAARAFAHFGAERWDAAIKDCDLALEHPGALRPFSVADVRTLRGRSLLHAERLDDAIVELSTAIDLDQRCAEAFATRAEAYLAAGCSAGALADAQHATELDPSACTSAVRSAVLIAVADAEGATASSDRRRALFDATEVASGWKLKADEGDALCAALTDAEVPLGIFRCARHPDVMRHTVLLITTGRMLWCRSPTFGPREIGWLAFAAIDEVTAEPSDVTAVSRAEQVTVRLSTFTGGVDLLGAELTLNGADDARELARALAFRAHS